MRGGAGRSELRLLRAAEHFLKHRHGHIHVGKRFGIFFGLERGEGSLDWLVFGYCSFLVWCISLGPLKKPCLLKEG